MAEDAARSRQGGLDAGPLAMFAQPAFMLPNGLLPLPARTHATSFARELEALRRTPVDLLRFDLRVAWGELRAARAARRS